ncbi:hypothetical protein PR003_g11446 [Phytophthora rubi]|uniref:RxLR effector protein n=1 Tax=Phytophthora rubi TaxID=129364 RepID=A0A6A3ISQ1_9STRA|nr:hypothetical protein PR002_g24092 [Phytophthora rubi]KAE8982483.1 hypothetical protein PR001_g23712 [Phytophthora rubi]KAE9338551.1 hypothetical protein PR003_g11446 [Phytophthora rubi]
MINMLIFNIVVPALLGQQTSSSTGREMANKGPPANLGPSSIMTNTLEAVPFRVLD